MANITHQVENNIFSRNLKINFVFLKENECLISKEILLSSLCVSCSIGWRVTLECILWTPEMEIWSLEYSWSHLKGQLTHALFDIWPAHFSLNNLNLLKSQLLCFCRMKVEDKNFLLKYCFAVILIFTPLKQMTELCVCNNFK